MPVERGFRARHDATGAPRLRRAQVRAADVPVTAEMTVPASDGATPAMLRLGSCPDSWGVWFADDPQQTPWQRFLDELADVGYEWLELGPVRLPPHRPLTVADELGRRGLMVAGGTMHGSRLHLPRTSRSRWRRPARSPIDRGDGRQARHLRPGAGLSRRYDRRLPRARGADRRAWGTLSGRRTSSAGSSPRSTASTAVPPACGQPRRDPRADRALPR